jgi:uncharacterized protein YjbI with pentapeptide repeats
MKKIDQEKLSRILTDHRLWLSTDGKLGKRADLQGAGLREADLCGADLQRADLHEADLYEADLWQADLRWADLRDVNLPLSIRDCYSFHGAKFSPEALPWLILHPQWSEWKDSVQIAAGQGTTIP